VTAAITPLDIGVYGARAIPSTYSGYETFLTTLLPQLVDRGHRVTMYCRRTDLDDATPYRGVRRHLLPALPGKQLNTLSHGAVAAIRARLANHDVVLVVNVANAPFCAIGSWSGQPVVLNTDGQEWLRGKWGRFARWVFRSSARIAGRTATALVSDCQAMAEVYRRDFDAESTIIPYCAPPIEPTDDLAALEQYGVEPGGYHLIAGRLNPENNIDRIAEAYAASEPSRPLLVLGAANYDSPVQRSLERIAANTPLVRPVGHVGDRKAFLTLVARAASYLHGHSVGGMNPSLVEAMHAGALVLANDTVFNRETLADTGRFFRLDGAGTGLAEAVREVEALSPGDVDELRRRARTRARDRFALETVTDAYEQLFLVTRSAPSRPLLAMPTLWSQV
jgi:glycosyltransferase involved in cell wall biosynthesis